MYLLNIYILVALLSFQNAKCDDEVYSSHKSHKVYSKSQTLEYIELNNVCLSSKEKTNYIIYFQNRNEEDLDIYLTTTIYRSFFETFEYGISHVNVSSKMFLDRKNVWVISQSVKNHIVHFMELYMSLWFYNNNEYNMPPMETLIHLVYYPPNDLDFNYLLYKMLLNKIKSTENNNNEIREIFLYKLLRKYTMICFKHINLFLKHQSIGLHSWFSNKNEHIQFRDYIFNELRIKNEIDSKKNEIKICIIVRNKNEIFHNRKILNLKEVYKIIKEKVKKEISIISFDKMNPKEQIIKIMKYNLIISPHGCSLFNMIWLMERKIIIIEIFNKYFIRQELLKESISYEYHYMPIFTTKQIYEDEQKYKNIELYYIKCNLICNGVRCLDVSFGRGSYDIYTNLKVLLFSLDYSINYLKN